VDSFRNIPWNAHRRGADEKWNRFVLCLNDHRCADRQFPGVISLQETLQPVLKIPPKEIRVDQIDAAIHEPEAVRRTEDGIRFHPQNVTFVNMDAGMRVKVSRPRLRHCRIQSAEMKFDRHASSRTVQTASASPTPIAQPGPIDR